MNKSERQIRILQLLAEGDDDSHLATRDLAALLGVSEMTVRRDLQALARGGQLLRQHGGARPVPLVVQPVHQGQVGIVLVSATGKYSDPFFSVILEGIDRRLRELGYHIAHINSRSEVNTVAQAQALLETNPVDGIVILGFASSDSLRYLRQHIHAIVQTTECIDDALDTITMDGYNGIRNMVAHLAQVHGYRRLGFISGASDARHEGFMAGVGACGLPLSPQQVVIVPYGLDGWTPDLGHIGTAQLMALAEPPEAIVCASDRIAIGALQWLHQHQYRVPEDVAIVGFDNIHESAFTAPALTTVQVHKQLIGELAAERLVRLIEQRDTIPLLIQTPTELVIRQSCGCHPSA